MSWLSRLDARMARASRPARWLYIFTKGLLIALGTYLLVGHYISQWGVAAALWFLLIPLAYGLWEGWPSDHPPSTPGPR